MDVEMPDGTTVEDVPDGTTQAQLQAKYSAHVAAPQPAGPPVTANTGPNGVPLPEGSQPLQSASPAPATPEFERFLSMTPSGRILDAFGQGLKDGWGAGPPGLSPESEKAMRDAGVFNDYSKNSTSILKTFNEAIMRPAAAGMDAMMRGGNAALTALGEATGQTVNETGLTAAEGQDPNTVREEFGGMAQMLPQALGVANELGVIAKPAAAAEGDVAGEAQAVSAAPGEAAPPTRTMATSEGLQQPHAVFSQDASASPDKAGNINLDNITASADVKDIIRKTAADNGNFVDARRGVISLSQTEQLADALGMTPDSLNTRRIGTAFNAEEITAARNMLVQSATNVRDLAKAVDPADEASVQAFVEAEAKHKAIQEQVSGVTAEGGRALNAFKINARATGEAQDLSDVLKGLGDSTDDAVARAKGVAELDTPNKVSAFLNSTRKPTFKDQFLEYWINGLLSGPATHTTYAESNALMALWKGGVEAPVAGAIGAARQVAAGAPVDRVFMGETAAQLHGFAQGAVEGIPAAWRAMKSGVTEALPGEQQMGKLVPKIPGLAGHIITVPSRVIAGIHTFGRTIGYRQELNALAYRQAAKAGLEGDDFATSMAQTKANPPEDMVSQAADAATKGTMMARPNGGFGAKLESLANANVVTKMIAPFVRVGLNIVDQGLVQRTPIGLMSQDVRDTLMGEHGEAARDTQIARMGVGSALGAATIALTAQGYITGGGPSDPKAAAMWRMTGKQPYSVRIGQTWYGYHRLGSLGQIVGVAADMHDIGSALQSEDAAHVASLVTNSVAKNMVDETWMKGPADLFQAVLDPDRYGAAYVRNQLTTLLPFSVGMNQVARAIDPDVRNARTILDAAKVKIPFVSESVRPRYDIWGQPMQNQGSLGPDAFSALYESHVNNDPVNLELNRLGVFPSRPEQKIRGAQLTPDQYDEFQMTAGRLAKMGLDSQVNMPGWDQLPDFVQKEAIENIVKSSRTAAEGNMQMRHPELIQQGVDNRIKQIRGVAK